LDADGTKGNSETTDLSTLIKNERNSSNFLKQKITNSLDAAKIAKKIQFKNTY
jgi:hypothetical protein